MARQTTDGIDPDDPDALEAMAERLEAALDRIGRHLDRPRPVSHARPQGLAAQHAVADLTTRLDGLIARLRGVLGEPPGRPEL